VNPELDKQPRRGAWPNPVDTALDRARRIAGMYRAQLRILDLDACNRLDDTAASFGETWMLDKPDIIDGDRELTTNEAAELVQVQPNTIHHWARCKHPDGSGAPLLPRFGWRGKERTYIAAKVLEAAAIAARGQLTR
jgi:hypothetical protein